MFTFLLFLVMSGLCFITYYYFSSKIVHLRKQLMLLRNQNEDLRRKLSKLTEEPIADKHKNYATVLLLENKETIYEDE